MMMDTGSESDMMSFDLSSSSSSSPSPKPMAYYVQSPSSRDSHDVDDDESSTTALTQATATPIYDSPSESYSYGPFSRLSSSSSSGGFRWKGRRGMWPPPPPPPRPEGHVFHEVGGGRYEDLYGDKGWISTWKCRVLLFMVAVALIFTVFCSIVWGASKPFIPVVIVKSLKVHGFELGGGLDRTGVPTNILSMKSSVNMTVENPASFFGIHVSSSPLKLIFYDFTLATGQLKSYYQPRKSKHMAMVELTAVKVPLYGAGPYLAASDRKGRVPVKLELEIQTCGNIIGKLVRSKHRNHLSCSFYISSRNSKLIQFTDKTCRHVIK
ncbi:PREDICTED: uncharacterized protein LOC104809106 [Tarenaya hassleriana]|uniref:uncharacterized protein LOC104809106 n=1 Tax=Tarenaya hassleriana TaxID=28532 RepID=UPI0008FD4642|nr:PREDICTED: uncharacterized protein LOC104809106 [Tarenaya hassleriana]